jgi:transposase-like protein
MPAKKAAAVSKGKRYSEQEKAEILAFADAQGRGGASAAAKKFKVSPLTISNWRKVQGSGRAPQVRNASSQVVVQDDVLRVLAQKGFKVVRMMNALTGEIIEDRIDPKVEKLGLEFGGPRGKADDGKTYVVQSSGQILVTMTLDRLLSITGTKP